MVEGDGQTPDASHQEPTLRPFLGKGGEDVQRVLRRGEPETDQAAVENSIQQGVELAAEKEEHSKHGRAFHHLFRHRGRKHQRAHFGRGLAPCHQEEPKVEEEAEHDGGGRSDGHSPQIHHQHQPCRFLFVPVERCHAQGEDRQGHDTYEKRQDQGRG